MGRKRKVGRPKGSKKRGHAKSKKRSAGVTLRGHLKKGYRWAKGGKGRTIKIKKR